MKKINLVAFLLLATCVSDHIHAEADHGRMPSSFLLTIINKLEQGENVIFTKFGDGEYNCIVNNSGTNCDGDSYHPWLAARLKASFLNLLTKKNTYLGRWGTECLNSFFEKLASEKNLDIPWCSYHLVMNDDDYFRHDYMYKFVEFIINTKRKKIIVGNAQNAKLKDLFRADIYVTIPAQSWSYEYDKWLKIVESEVEENAIILISGGLCSKVLIDEITDRHKVTSIDLGSSFDLLVRKKKSRAWVHSYEDDFNYYKKLLPKNWNQ